MREQATDRTFRQQVAGDLAVCPFPQSRAAVAAGDDQADVFVRDERSNEFAARSVHQNRMGFEFSSSEARIKR